jgi:hypothetical protein
MWALRALVARLSPLFPLNVVLFVVFLAWFLSEVVDLRLVSAARHVLFLWNIRYLTDFLGQPGSLLEWTDNLLVQLCCFGWPAVMAITVMTWLLLVSTIGLMARLGGGNVAGVWVIPGVLVVALYCGYALPTPVIVGLAVAVAAANGWVRMPVCRPWLRLILFVVVSTVLYDVMGEAYYCFAACCVIHEALAERRWISGVLLLLAAVAVKFGLDAFLAQVELASRNFHVFSPDELLNIPADWRMVTLYLYFPACALFAVFRRPILAATNAAWRRLGKSAATSPSPQQCEGGRENHRQPGISGRNLASTRITLWVQRAAAALLPLTLAAAAGFYSVDRQVKLLLQIDFCAENAQWEDVLAKARTLPRAAYSEYVNHDVNRALYQTGRLPYQMLSYPQIYLPLLSLNDVRGRTPCLCKPCDLLLEMGRVNEAEHLTLEMLEVRPFGGVLKRLALVKLIKGQTAAAHMLLNVLRDDLVWGRWAEQHLQCLAADPQLVDDDEVQRLRGLMISKDDMHLFYTFLPGGGVSFNNKILLLDLLKQNGENRMAFEYLMAICLCDKDLEAVAHLFSFLDGLPYPATPPLYEEALLLYFDTHPDEKREVGSGVFFRGRQISESTMKRFRRLKEIAAQCGRASEKMRSSVAGELGDTYFYYYYYSTPKRRS